MDLNNPSLRQLVLYFLKLGATGFGGPVALIGYMERDLVQDRGWFSLKEYKQGLALSQLAPGPVATQLAIYLGHVHSGLLGATLIGVAFILPSFVIVVVLAAAYVHYGGLPWVNGVLYGVGAAVIGIMLRSAFRLTRSTMDKRRFLWAVYALLAVVTALWQTEIGWLFILSGVAALFLYAPPRGLSLRSLAPLPLLGLMAPQGLPPVSAGVLSQMFLFFAKSSALVFGSGLVIVPFLYGGVVREFQWLNERQFLDAVAMAMITPGPVTITVAFIGYLVAGLAGSSVAALGMFLPVYLFVVIPAAWFRKHGSNPQIEAFVDGVTAAAIGALTGAVFILTFKSIRDLPSAFIALACLLALQFTRIPEPLLVVLAGGLGFFLKSL